MKCCSFVCRNAFLGVISLITLDGVAAESRVIRAYAHFVRQPPRTNFVSRDLRSTPARTLRGASFLEYRRSSKPLGSDAAGNVNSGGLKYVSDSRQTRMRSAAPFVSLQLRKRTKPPPIIASFGNDLTSRRVRAIAARGPLRGCAAYSSCPQPSPARDDARFSCPRITIFARRRARGRERAQYSRDGLLTRRMAPSAGTPLPDCDSSPIIYGAPLADLWGYARTDRLARGNFLPESPRAPAWSFCPAIAPAGSWRDAIFLASSVGPQG